MLPNAFLPGPHLPVFKERATGSSLPGSGEGVKTVAWQRTGQLRVAGSKTETRTESPHLVPASALLCGDSRAGSEPADRSVALEACDCCMAPGADNGYAA